MQNVNNDRSLGTDNLPEKRLKESTKEEGIKILRLFCKKIWETKE